MKILDNSVEAELVNAEAAVKLQFSLFAVAGDIFRVTVDEVKPLHPRYRVEGGLDGEPRLAR